MARTQKRGSVDIQGEVPTTKRQKPTRELPNSSSTRKKSKVAAVTRPSQVLDIYVCGSGDFGELGLGPSTASAKKPLLNQLLLGINGGIVQVAAGGMHCVALAQDGAIYTWGVNDNGALGRDTNWDGPPSDAESEEEDAINPYESAPTVIPAQYFGDHAASFAQVAATDSASFALTTDGHVYGWGTFLGSAGKLGLDEQSARRPEEIRFNPRPVLIPQLKNIRFLAAGGNHMLALDNKGDLFSWGCGQQRQLGRRLTSRMESHGLTPTRVSWTRKKFNGIAAGAYHSFAVDTDGTVYSWGLNNFCQTGIPSHDPESDSDSIIGVPTQVLQLKDYAVHRLVGGTHHSIACTRDHKLLVWGRCDDGQLGAALNDLDQKDLVFDSRGRPRIMTRPYVHKDIKAASIAAGIDTCMAISPDGTAYAWGFSAGYRLGLGTEETVEIVTPVMSEALRGKTLSFAACGGQFSVLAGPAAQPFEHRNLTNGL